MTTAHKNKIQLDPELSEAGKELKIRLDDTLRPLSKYPGLLEDAKEVLSTALKADKISGAKNYPVLEKTNILLIAVVNTRSMEAMAMGVECLGAMANEGPEAFADKVNHIYPRFLNRALDKLFPRSPPSDSLGQLEKSRRLK